MRHPQGTVQIAEPMADALGTAASDVVYRRHSPAFAARRADRHRDAHGGGGLDELWCRRLAPDRFARAITPSRLHWMKGLQIGMCGPNSFGASHPLRTTKMIRRSSTLAMPCASENGAGSGESAPRKTRSDRHDGASSRHHRFKPPMLPQAIKWVLILGIGSPRDRRHVRWGLHRACMTEVP